MHRKYSEAVPLYRQEKGYQNFEIDLSRQNLDNWIVHGANTWLKPLYNRMHEKLPNIDLDSLEELDKLLPWSDTILETCRVLIKNMIT